jgi:hypothetical protein
MRERHGKTNTPEYRIWTDMHTRCSNPKFKDFRYYGGRGIAVCERWKSFSNFFADMGQRPSPRHSIDRRDSDGPYAPENCRWATSAEQANNKSTTILITIGGVTKPLAEWCAQRGVKRQTAWLRFKSGVRGAALFAPQCTVLSHDGITDTIAGWSKRTGIKATTISMRVNKYGWPIADAITKGARL